MLIGTFEHNMDPKGRVFVPAKWREDLADTIILTRGMRGQGDSQCLMGMSLESWKSFSKRFSAIPMTDLKAQNVRRMLFANASDCDVDKQGRILIPNMLREHARIEREVALIGVDDYIEIWDTEAWKEYTRQCDAGELDIGYDLLAQRGI